MSQKKLYRPLTDIAIKALARAAANVDGVVPFGGPTMMTGLVTRGLIERVDGVRQFRITAAGRGYLHASTADQPTSEGGVFVVVEHVDYSPGELHAATPDFDLAVAHAVAAAPVEATRPRVVIVRMNPGPIERWSWVDGRYQRADCVAGSYDV